MHTMFQPDTQSGAPSTAGARQAALRHAADRAETAITGLAYPLDRYLLELEPDRAEGRSWYGGPGAGELREWDEVLQRAGVKVSATRVKNCTAPAPAKHGKKSAKKT